MMITSQQDDIGAGSFREQLTISIVSHGHGALLQRLLEDLNSLPSLQGVRIILTLNLSSEDINVKPYRNLRIRIIRNGTAKGFAVNHNQAFAQCSTPWFAVLNPDLRVSIDVFPQLLTEAGRDAQIALVAPSVLSPFGEIEDSVRANLTPWAVLRRLISRGRPKPVPEQSFRWFAGMFYVIRSKYYAEVDGFNERFFLYCEDYDLCARLFLRCYELVHVEAAPVIHDARRDSHKTLRYSWLHVRSLLRVWFSLPVWRIAFRQITDAIESRVGTSPKNSRLTSQDR